MTEPTPLPTRRRARCPVCRRPASAADKPFCSPRCRDEDLRRWLSGGYRIPGEAAAPDADEEGG